MHQTKQQNHERRDLVATTEMIAAHSRGYKGKSKSKGKSKAKRRDDYSDADQGEVDQSDDFSDASLSGGLVGGGTSSSWKDVWKAEVAKAKATSNHVEKSEKKWHSSKLTPARSHIRKGQKLAEQEAAALD